MCSASLYVLAPQPFSQKCLITLLKNSNRPKFASDYFCKWRFWSRALFRCNIWTMSHHSARAEKLWQRLWGLQGCQYLLFDLLQENFADPDLQNKILTAQSSILQVIKGRWGKCVSDRMFIKMIWGHNRISDKLDLKEHPWSVKYGHVTKGGQVSLMGAAHTD